MAVSNGQLANQTTFNNAFVSRTNDSSTVGKITLSNADTNTITDIQREANSAASFMGKAVNIAASALPEFTEDYVGATGDDLFNRVDALTLRFDGDDGHGHTGNDGDGPQINSLDLANYNPAYATVGTKFIQQTGSLASADVTTDFSSESPFGSTGTAGVLTVIDGISTAAQTNIVRIRDANGNAFFDGDFEVVGWLEVENLEADPEEPPDYEWILVFKKITPSGIDDATIDVEGSDFGFRIFYTEVFLGDRPTLWPVLDSRLFGAGGGGGAGGGLFEVDTFTGTVITATTAARQLWKYTGSSAQTITQIDVGNLPEGGEIRIIGSSNVDTATLSSSATGVRRMNGPWVAHKDSILTLMKEGSDLVEVSRNGL